MNYKDVLESEYFKETYLKIEELKKDFYVNHGFIHIDGVIKNAKYLADLFGLTSKDKDLLLIASALHDIGYLMGRDDHAKNGGKLVKDYLNGKMEEKDIEVISRAVACHGGKSEEDFKCPVSMCLILADKLDFTKVRYKDDGKEHSSLHLFLSIEKILFEKVDGNNYRLNIYTTNKFLFNDLEDNYFFAKLIEMFKRLENACGYKTTLNIIEANDI